MDHHIEDNNDNNDNHDNNEQKEIVNVDVELPQLPDNVDELEDTLGVDGARLFQESALLSSQQIERRPESEMSLIIVSQEELTS